ncbi:hypothetical protein BDZ45DRAFT_297358 [Acephala macrosclerotiorum]|nr:hypothetical protein BDZ45DRAFT_297358 [Acephala macrosclerotiorum]
MEALNARISVHFLLLLLRRGSRSFFLLSLILLLQGGLGLTARGSVRRILHSHYLTSEIVVAKNGMSEKCKSWLRNAGKMHFNSNENCFSTSLSRVPAKNSYKCRTISAWE